MILDNFPGYEEKEKEYYRNDLKNLISRKKSGLNILDARYVASINVRYCHYYSGEPYWFLLTLWRN